MSADVTVAEEAAARLKADEEIVARLKSGDVVTPAEAAAVEAAARLELLTRRAAAEVEAEEARRRADEEIARTIIAVEAGIADARSAVLDSLEELFTAMEAFVAAANDHDALLTDATRHLTHLEVQNDTSRWASQRFQQLLLASTTPRLIAEAVIRGSYGKVHLDPSNNNLGRLFPDSALTAVPGGGLTGGQRELLRSQWEADTPRERGE